LAGATSEQLGWDNTIHRVIVQEETRYEIEVGGDRYQTVRLLADFRANSIVGRATRVWEAKKMEWDHIEKRYFVPGGRASVVVKDLWINKQESQEAMTIKRLRYLLFRWREDNPNAPDASDYSHLDPDPDPTFTLREARIDEYFNDPMFAPDEPPNLPGLAWGDAPYDRYFPHVLAHGYVKLGNGLLDCSDQLVRPGKFAELRHRDHLVFMSQPIPRTSSPPGVATASGSTAVVTQGGSQTPRKEDGVLNQFRDAVHYRIVLEHIGTRLDAASDLNDVFAGLKDAAIGEWFTLRTVPTPYHCLQVSAGCFAWALFIAISRWATFCACRSALRKA
jgi:hypothetical protein